MQKPIFSLCPGTDFTSCFVGMFPLGLRGAWKPRGKSYGQYINWVQAKKKDEKLVLNVMKRFLECFNYLGFWFFFFFFSFQNLELVHVQEDNPFTIT